jgi:hypothetical protein
MVSNNADASLSVPCHSSEKRRRALELPRSAAATRARHAAAVTEARLDAGERISPAAAKPPRLSRPAIARDQLTIDLI